jgi:hypothetical protein
MKRAGERMVSRCLSTSKTKKPPATMLKKGRILFTMREHYARASYSAAAAAESGREIMIILP